jgi:acetolactate synthase-1/2/3 large subunit
MGTGRWDTVAAGLGCHAEYVERIDDIDNALQRARKAEGPALVCLKTNRDANLSIPQDLLLRFIVVYQGPIG